MASKNPKSYRNVHTDEQAFPHYIWNQKQYPKDGWEDHTIGNDAVALAVLDVLDH